MSNHAPAPWSLYCNNKDEFVVRKMHPETKELCQIAKVNGYENARLIAAAPELLEALDALRTELFFHSEGNYFRPLLDKAGDALMNARGEI